MQSVTITEITPPELEELIENSIKRFFSHYNKSQSIVELDRWFDIKELCEYLPDKPAKPTVYGWVHGRSIPYHKGGKKLRFLKSEIDKWLATGKKKTISEIVAEADKYLQSRKVK